MTKVYIIMRESYTETEYGCQTNSVVDRVTFDYNEAKKYCTNMNSLRSSHWTSYFSFEEYEVSDSFSVDK